MKVPDDLLYTKEHEWVKVEGDVATVGITDYAQDQLGDIIYVELPEVGRKVKQMEAVATVEAVKTAADVYAPVSGEVIEVNSKLSEKPELLNEDPYGEGWMFKLRMENPEELKGLLSPEEYRKLIEAEG